MSEYENMPFNIKVTVGELKGTPVIGVEAKPLLSAFREVPEAPCDQPVFLRLQDGFFIAVFDDEDKLHEQMKLAQAPDYKIKVITDLDEFMDSFSGTGVRVMFNPYHKDGKMRWKELRHE